MRIIIVVSILLFFSCNKKQVQNANHVVEVFDSPMVEVSSLKKVSTVDSIGLLKTFEEFCLVLYN